MIAENNEIISVGQGYKSRQGCLKGIRSIKKNVGDASVYHREEGDEIKDLEEIDPIKDDESVLAMDVTGDEEIPPSPTAGEESKGEETVKILGNSAAMLAVTAMILAVLALILLITGL